MERYILAVDQGTTSTRAILFDHDKHIFQMSQKEVDISFPQPGWVEQDPTNIWLTTEAVMSEVLLKSGIWPDQVAAIGISNQRETALIWDKRTGRPVYNAIVWQSRQTDGICDAWKKAGYEKIIKEKTGLKIDPYFSASKIKWILDHIENGYERAEKGELLFGTIDCWLVWKLSGQKEHITDPSNASRTMLCNIHTGEWDDELLDLLQIPKAMLPKIMPTSYPYTKTASYLFYNAEIPICSIIGDQQAALFGQGCLKAGMVKNTYGTGGFILMNTGEKVVDSRSGLLSTIAWKINGQLTYALEGSIFVSGSLIKWMRDKLELFEETKNTEFMAEQAKTCGGVYIVPAFVGLGAPYWDEKARASIVGLTLGTNRDQLVRAALESMAYQSRDVLEVMKKDTGIDIDVLKVDGGATANRFLLQFQADLLGCRVERFKLKELTAMGAAFLAGLACGFWKKEDLSIELDCTFYPRRKKPAMDLLYENWKKAVEATRLFKPMDIKDE